MRAVALDLCERKRRSVGKAGRLELVAQVAVRGIDVQVQVRFRRWVRECGVRDRGVRVDRGGGGRSWKVDEGGRCAGVG